MSDERRVLVLEEHRDCRLSSSVERLGLKTIVLDSMRPALSQLRRSKIEAVFVDRDHISDDALEFVLNATDITPAVPIVLVRTRENPCLEEHLDKLRNVFFIDGNERDVSTESSRILKQFDLL